MVEKEYFHKGKTEKKKNVMLTIYESVLEGVRRRQKEAGGRLSPLVENLLIDWTIQYDRLHDPKRIQEMEKKAKKQVEKLREQLKQEKEDKPKK